MENFLGAHHFPFERIYCKSKKDWVPAFFKLRKSLKKLKPDVVHCNLFVANILGLSAAKWLGVRQRIYTRHHSSLHHIYFKKGVFWDKLCNRFATRIIAISGMVKKILVEWEQADPKKIVLVPHGFELEVFSRVDEARVAAFMQRLQLQNENYVVGVVSRFVIWKGIQHIIPAFKKFLKIKPGAVLLLLNASGDHEPAIRKLLEDIPAANYRLVKFENDIAAAFQSMDQFVHVPIDEHSEAFGQTYIESLAACIPSIFTLSGIAADLIVDGVNALVVPFADDEAIYKAMVRLADNAVLAKSLSDNGYETVKGPFALEKMIREYETLYNE
jgi:glycosyltransferase involved in cell wall biosynthesis